MTVNCLVREIHKEEKRMRGLQSEHPAVALAMTRRRDEEEAALRVERNRVASMNEEKRDAEALQASTKEAARRLKRAREQLADVEKLIETRNQLKTFSLASLGDGLPRGGGAPARKRRFEVLDRMLQHGAGLSPAQQNDWKWFKEAWDEHMLLELKEQWGHRFAEYMQGILVRIEAGEENALSLFMHSETRRVLETKPALQM